MSKSRAAKARLSVVNPDQSPPAALRGASVDPAPVLAPVLARIVGWVPGAGPQVAVADEIEGAARVARSTVKLTEAEGRAMAERSQEVLVAFARNAPEVPIIVGLLQPPPGDPAQESGEVVIDGERIVLRGKREVELRCGEGAIILKQDGLVVLKGAAVESRARGVNRIRGGSVKIN